MSPQQQQQQQPESPQVHSTSKVDDFYINSTYPDDSETPPTMTQKRTSIHATSQWQETRSTQSEADVCRSFLSWPLYWLWSGGWL
jgi:hypothetical protein